jgi:FtsZ-binding cell division protein ZapB
MSAELKKVSREYAERVCNGEFPITYSREQVVNHTANDFTEGWNRSIEENKPDWFKAGGMAERILIDWEMKQLKSKLNDITTYYAKSVLSCDALQQENNELKSKQNALEQRIKMLVEKAECQNK